MLRAFKDFVIKKGGLSIMAEKTEPKKVEKVTVGLDKDKGIYTLDEVKALLEANGLKVEVK